MLRKSSINVICDKFSEALEPPKLVVPITVKEPFSTWSIVAVGLMSIANNDSHTKKRIITSVVYVTRWTVVQAEVICTSNDICRFIGKDCKQFWGTQAAHRPRRTQVSYIYH